MTEEQNKLADRLQAMLNQVGHPDYSLRELYEGLKLIVWELRQEREPDPVLGECEECGHTIVTPLKRFREREPATEAVRGTMSEVTAPVIAAPGAFNLSEFVNAADIGGADSPHQVVYKLQRAINATLQGKGASQGAEGPIDMMAELKNRLAAPEPSGEFVRVRKDVVEFLRGAAPLDGFWFGEKPLELQAFWWRKYLSDEQKG